MFRERGWWLASCLSAYLCLFSMTCLASFITDEENLRSALLSNYTVKVRPDYKVDVNVILALHALIHLDITDQTMSVIATIILQWYDSRLVWNEASYGGLEVLVTAPEDIWTPTLVVENAASDVGVIGGKERDATPVRISSSGLVSWYPPQEITTVCEMAIANYPFDTQRCSIILIGWGYPVAEVNITAVDTDIIRSYTANGEFEVMDAAVSHSHLQQPNATYRKLHFDLTIRRKWLFYGQNLLIPTVANSILMNVVFLLPIESGEKLGYSLTVLLSYVVFLTWVTESLPHVSTDTSILQVYLTVVFCLGVMATLLTTWVLRLYHTPESHHMTIRCRKIAHSVLEPFFNFVHGKKKNPQEGNKIKGHSKVTSMKVSPYSPRPLSGKQCHHHGNATETGDDDDIDHSLDNANGDEEELPSYTWQELAILYDCFFCYTFACVLFTITLSIFALLSSQY